MSKFKLFVPQDKFSRIAQIFLKFSNGKHDWKIEKFFWKTVEKLAKDLHAFATLARQVK